MISEYPDVRYARSSGDVQIAYEVIGEGDLDIVFALGLVPNLEMSREVSFLRRWLERLTRVARVVHYDRRGVGLSDRDLSMGAPEERMDDIRAVMDASGIERASLVTSVDGGPIALMFAATYPDRVDRLALYESWARTRHAPDFPIGLDHASGGLAAHAREHWGDGTTLERVVGDAADAEAARSLLARLERTNSSPRVAHRHFELSQEVDVRAALSSVQAPTLVVGRRDVAYTPLGRWLADELGAEYVELAGSMLHSWRDAYEDEVLDHVERFLTGAGSASGVAAERVLQTLLFADIVDSTVRAEELGDFEWRNLLGRHDAAVQREVSRHRGRLVKHTGDGVLAVFDGPARAVRCARIITERTAELGLPIRVGLHTGECEMRGDDVAGVAVHLASRVCALAGPGEVLATTTVRDLVVGSGLSFENRGSHTLKGIAEPWGIVASVDSV